MQCIQNTAGNLSQYQGGQGGIFAPAETACTKEFKYMPYHMAHMINHCIKSLLPLLLLMYLTC